MTELHDRLDAYLRTLELDEAREAPVDAPPLTQQRARLHAAWLDAARLAVQHAVSDDAFNLREHRTLLDFGVFEHPWFAEAGVEPDQDCNVEGVLLMHDALAETFDDVLRRDNLQQIQAQLAAVRNDIALWPQMHLAHVQYRDTKAREALQDSAKVPHVLRLLAEMDEKLEPLKKLQAREDSTLSGDERKALSTLARFLQTHRAEVSAVLAPPASDAARTASAGACLTAMDAVEASVAHLVELHARRVSLERQCVDEESAARSVSKDDVQRAIVRELEGTTRLLRLAARYAGREECAVPVDLDTHVITPELAADAVEHILTFDPRLLDNPLSARFGHPALLLAPGIGDGVHDATRNRWLVPQRCAGGVLRSISHAAVLYRLDADAAKALLAVYRDEIPANRGMRANLKLRSSLIRDYITWMTDEAAGIESLPRATREWFERHIAPPADQPWVPADYRSMDAARLRRERTNLAREDGPETAWRRAIIDWLLDDSDAAVLERALPLLDKALNEAPSFAPALYSRAVLRMQMKQFRHAIDDFRAFMEATPRSWWTLKATELCARCR